MMSIAYREGLKIPPPALNDIIQAANQDIRQVRNRTSSLFCVISLFSISESVMFVKL